MDRSKYQHVAIENEERIIWEALKKGGTQVDRFHEKIVPNKKSILFGYADVTIAIPTLGGAIVPIKLRGLVVKLVNGNPRVDNPAEKGADGEWYDHFMARSPALRKVVTLMIFRDAQVTETIARATELENRAETTQEQPAGDPSLEELMGGSGSELTISDDNPFAS